MGHEPVSPAWVGLSLCKNLGGKTFRTLLRHFQHDLDAILCADARALQEVPGIGPKIARSIQNVNPETVSRDIDRWQHQGLHIVTWDAPDYPPALRNLEDRPPTLFILGEWPLKIEGYAIVGTRSPGGSTKEAAQILAATLAAQGQTIISGLATGIDTAAHLGALATPQGKTVAVLGSGVLNIYPPENRALAQAITQRGTLICEVAPNATVSTPGLVSRNRLITGLSKGVIIVETEINGGAMHAARFAQRQNRPLFAVDVPASGNQHLLKSGAEGISLAQASAAEDLPI